MALTLGALLRQDMISEGLSVLVAFGSFLEPLGCTTTCSKLGHFHTPHSTIELCSAPHTCEGHDLL
jgi:hypothetical protein